MFHFHDYTSDRIYTLTRRTLIISHFHLPYGNEIFLRKYNFFYPLPPSSETNHVITSNTSNFLLLKKMKKKESTTTIFFKLYLFTYLFFILSYCPPLSISFSFFFFWCLREWGSLIFHDNQSLDWTDRHGRMEGGGGQKGGLKKEGKIKKERETYKKRKYGGERNGRKPNPTVFSWTCCLAEKEMNEWLQRHLSSIRKVWC